mgnify:CR=1 FL=1|tara:strand:+ start:1810 stop:3708 length:1899 start_codon:yes stop_codon:yes gene_type:complete
MTLDEVRQKYPQYKEVPDDKLAPALYDKFYKDKISFEDFSSQIGYTTQPQIDISSLPEVARAPEFNELSNISMPAVKAGLGVLLADNDESAAQIIKQQFGDEAELSNINGKQVVTLPSGQYVINKEGFSATDFAKGFVDALAFTPAGKAGTVAGAIGANAATQAGIDIAEQGLGGEDMQVEDTLMAGALGGAFKGAENIIGGLYRYFRGSPANEIVREGAEQGVPVMTSDVLPPATFAGKISQQTAEKIPLAGTGAAREVQQDFRNKAVQEIADKYGTFSYKSIIDSMKTQQNRVKGAAGRTLQSTGEKLDEVGEVPLSSTREIIDEVKAELSKEGVIRSEGAADDLATLVNAFDEAPQTFTSLKENRTAFRDIIEGADKAERSQLPSRAKALLQKVGGAMTEDMESFAKSNLTPKEFASWKKANKIYADQAQTLKKSKLKNVLDKGDITPESVKQLILSKNPSELKLAYNSMTQSGKANARSAVISNIVDNVSRRAGGMTPNAFATEMKKFKPQIDTFFKGQERKQLEGLQRLLNATRRAQDAAVTTPTGQQVLGAGTLAAAATDLGATILSAGTVGGIARLYESAPVRNALLRLASVPKGSTRFEKALLDAQTAINAGAQSGRSAQSEQE